MVVAIMLVVTAIAALFADQIYLFLGYTPIEYWVPWTFWLVLIAIGVEALHLYITFQIARRFFKPLPKKAKDKTKPKMDKSKERQIEKKKPNDAENTGEKEPPQYLF